MNKMNYYICGNPRLIHPEIDKIDKTTDLIMSIGLIILLIIIITGIILYIISIIKIHKKK